MKIFCGLYLLVIVAITNCSANEKYESDRTKFVRNSKEKKDNLFFHSYVKTGKKKIPSTRDKRPSFSIFVGHHQRDFYWNNEAIPLGQTIDSVISKKLVKNSKIKPLSQTKMSKSKNPSSLKQKEITVHNSNGIFSKNKYELRKKITKVEKNHNVTKSSNTLVQDSKVNSLSHQKMAKVENSKAFKSEKIISNEAATPLLSEKINGKNVSKTLIKDPKVQIGSQKQRDNLESLSVSKVIFGKVPISQKTEHKIKNQRTNVTIQSTLRKLEDTKNKMAKTNQSIHKKDYKIFDPSINEQLQTKAKNAMDELSQELQSLNEYTNKKSKKKIDKIQPLRVNVNNISKKHLSIGNVFKKEKHPSTSWNVEKEANESKKLLNAAKNNFHKVDDSFQDIMDDLESALDPYSVKSATNVLDHIGDLSQKKKKHEKSSKKKNQELSDITIQKVITKLPSSPKVEKKKNGATILTIGSIQILTFFLFPIFHFFF